MKSAIGCLSFKEIIILGFVLILVALDASTGVSARSLNGFNLNGALVPEKAIQHGGPPRDGIPAIHRPNFVSSAKAKYIKLDDIVFGIEVGNEAYAFPRYILNWHEIVNARFDNEYVVISYCPLCGSAMAFDAKVSGRPLNFGVSGLLFNSDLLLYDKETKSLWSQIEGRAITGLLKGQVLTQLPLKITTWADWKKDYPNSLVLSENQGFKRNYRREPYLGYETSSVLYFKTLRQAPRTFHTKERVLGVTLGGVSKAYAFSELKKLGKETFNDRFGGEDLTVYWNDKTETAFAKDSNGNLLVSTQAYWFAWYNFYPETLVFKSSEFQVRP